LMGQVLVPRVVDMVPRAAVDVASTRLTLSIHVGQLSTWRGAREDLCRADSEGIRLLVHSVVAVPDLRVQVLGDVTPGDVLVDEGM
jgi:hypothetical protein